MKKLKIKKQFIIGIILFILLLILFLINLLFFDKSYEVEYEVDGYNIRENYNDKDKIYSFVVENNNIKHAFYKNIKYNKNHQLITKINAVEIEDERCLIIEAPFNVMPLCENNDEAIDYRITSEMMQEQLNVKKIDEKIQKYNNYTMYNDIGYNYIVWDYKNLINFSDDIKETNILSSDSYNFDLTARINEYLLIPDYDNKYSFNKFYIYNIEENTLEEMKIKYDISFDSYILGTYENSIYLVDKKNKVEYEIVPFKKKIRKIGTSNKKGLILTKKGLEKISLVKLCGETMSFYQNNNYNYEIINKTLYQNINGNKMKVSNNEVTDIIEIQNDSVLYLVDDTLYLYNLKYGEVKLISNFDWKFNYKNLIFLYIP